MENLTEIINNENKSICSKCGGRCCKAFPCCYMPSDLGILNHMSFNEIKKIIKTKLEEGKTSIDWYDDYKEVGKRGYFLRPKTKQSTEIIDPSWGGTCIYLTSTGCSLSWEDRPHGGKSLIPSPDFKCKGGDTKLELATQWEPYFPIIDAIIEEMELTYDDSTPYEDEDPFSWMFM